MNTKHRPQQKKQTQARKQPAARAVENTPTPAVAEVASPLSDMPDHATARPMRQAAVMQMQEQNGNAGVGRMMAGRGAGPLPESDAVQREGEDKNDSVALALLEANRPSMETARADALVRLGKMSLLEAEGNSAVNMMKDKLLLMSGRYDEAYNRYASVIAKAKAEARNQQENIDIALGIIIGVVVALTFEAVAAVAVVGAVGGVVVKALGKFGANVAKEAAGEGVEAAGGKGAKATGAFEVAGTELEPGGLKPEILKMEIWKSLLNLHQGLGKVRAGSLEQSLLMSSSEYAIGEIKSQRGGGADMTVEEDIELVRAINSANSGSKEIDTNLEKASEKLAALKAGIAAMPDQSVTEMEKSIWIEWMSSLSKGSNILDLDEIEDYIGPKGLGLVDFGFYTSDEDEDEAIENARRKVGEIKAAREKALSPGG